jgi:hypothetical protein
MIKYLELKISHGKILRVKDITWENTFGLDKCNVVTEKHGPG